jgi:hypothetical protein
MTDVTIDTYDFSQLAPETGHVLIHVDVGKLPPNRIRPYLEKFEANFPLCQQLNNLDIPYSIVQRRYQPNHVDVDLNVHTLSLNSEPECEIKEEPKTEEPWDKPYSRAMEQFLR